MGITEVHAAPKTTCRMNTCRNKHKQQSTTNQNNSHNRHTVYIVNCILILATREWGRGGIVTNKCAVSWYIDDGWRRLTTIDDTLQRQLLRCEAIVIEQKMTSNIFIAWRVYSLFNSMQFNAKKKTRQGTTTTRIGWLRDILITIIILTISSQMAPVCTASHPSSNLHVCQSTKFDIWFSFCHISHRWLIIACIRNLRLTMKTSPCFYQSLPSPFLPVKVRSSTSKKLVLITDFILIQEFTTLRIPYFLTHENSRYQHSKAPVNF